MGGTAEQIEPKPAGSGGFSTTAGDWHPASFGAESNEFEMDTEGAGRFSVQRHEPRMASSDDGILGEAKFFAPEGAEIERFGDEEMLLLDFGDSRAGDGLFSKSVLQGFGRLPMLTRIFP